MNLRRARKRAGRKVADDRAGENRIRHGLTKVERDTTRREAERLSSRLEAHRLDGSGLDDGRAPSPPVVDDRA